MVSKVSVDSVDSDVFYVEQLLNEPSPQRNNSPKVLNSTELSGIHEIEMPTISSVASTEPDIVTLDDDSIEPTMPYGIGRQLPLITPSLNDLNLPPNPFNILATMAAVNSAEGGYGDNYSPQSPEPSEPSPILTPPMNVSTTDGWETAHTTTDDNTFYSDDEPRRIYFLPSTPTPPPPPRKLKRELSLRMSFPKKGECRNTSASQGDNCFPSRRPYEVRQQQTKNSRLRNFIQTFSSSILF